MTVPVPKGLTVLWALKDSSSQQRGRQAWVPPPTFVPSTNRGSKALVTGQRSHGQEVAASRSVAGLQTPNPTLTTRLSLSQVAFRLGTMFSARTVQAQGKQVFTFGYYLAAPRGLRDLSSLTRD